MKTKTKYILISIIMAIGVGIDLVTKYIFKDIEYTKIIPNLIAFQTNGGNSGAAFGIFSKSTTFLIVFSVLLLALIIFVDSRLKIFSKTYCVGLALVLAGGLGNFIDRIALGYVRDFIMFDFWHSFPIFNFADCCITIGAVLIGIYLVFLHKVEDKK